MFYKIYLNKLGLKNLKDLGLTSIFQKNLNILVVSQFTVLLKDVNIRLAV